MFKNLFSPKPAAPPTMTEIADSFCYQSRFSPPPIRLRSEQWLQDAIDQINAEIAQQGATYRGAAIELLPFEQSGKRALANVYNADLQTVMQKRDMLTAELESWTAERERFAFDQRVEQLDRRFLRMRMDYLQVRTRDVNGFLVPVFGAFALNSEHSTIESTATQLPGSKFEVKNVMTAPSLAPHYADVLELLSAMAMKSVSKSQGKMHSASWGLWAEFPDVIPDEVRQTIRQEQRAGEFDEIFLIAETNWQVMHHYVEQPAPQPLPAKPLSQRDPDPFVIGRLGSGFWLIKAFDMTPAEQWAFDRFTPRMQRA